MNVRAEGEAIDISSFRDLVVSYASGSPVRLKDVAVVEDDKEQVVSITLIETILLRLTENTSKWNRSTKLAKKSQNRGRSLLLNWRKK